MVWVMLPARHMKVKHVQLFSKGVAQLGTLSLISLATPGALVSPKLRSGKLHLEVPEA